MRVTSVDMMRFRWSMVLTEFSKKQNHSDPDPRLPLGIGMDQALGTAAQKM